MQPQSLTTEQILALPYQLDHYGHAIIRLVGHPCAGKRGVARRARVVAYNAGLLTDPSKVVHHKDHDKSNDVPENFEIMEHGAHSAAHLKGNQYGIGHVVSETHRATLRARFLGVPKSPEQIEKHAAALRGRPLSEAHKRALSEALRGEKHPNFGRHWKIKCGLCGAEGHNVRTCTAPKVAA